VKTIILTSDQRGDRSSGAWLRDLGFQLIEAGCEVNMTRAEGDAAREMLALRGLEVAQVVEGFGPTAAAVRRQGATGAVGTTAAMPTTMRGHERGGGASLGGPGSLS